MPGGFDSKALKANMSLTKIETPELSAGEKTFLSLSEKYWGIQKRTAEFLAELNHPYKNTQFLLNGLRQILLDDIWLYHQSSDPEVAYKNLFEIIKRIKKAMKDSQVREMFIQTLIEFIGALHQQEQKKPLVIRQFLFFLEELIQEWPWESVQNSGYIKAYWTSLAEDKEYGERVFIMARFLQKKGLENWLALKSEMTRVIFESSENAFESVKEIFKELQHYLKENQQAKKWSDIAGIPFYNDIAALFKQRAEQLTGDVERIYYLLYLAGLDEMSHFKDYLMWDVNKNIRSVRESLNADDMIKLIDRGFQVFEVLHNKHKSVVLDCLQTLGLEVARYDESRVMKYFENTLIRFGFTSPGLFYVDEDWRLHVDEGHVKNIRVYLALIREAPEKYSRLISALIVFLKIGGIFIADTDLFQKEVTQLLNSEIAPVFNRIKQLLRLFPVYFNEIGAEGELREFSTAVDELGFRRDKLIHFIRKQIHTESNNTHIDLLEETFDAWQENNPERLRGRIPADIMTRLHDGDDEFQQMSRIVQQAGIVLNKKGRQLLQVNDNALKRVSGGIKDEPCFKKISYLITIYRLLKEKYSFQPSNLMAYIRKASPDVGESGRLARVLKESDPEKKIKALYQIMKRMNHTILSPNHYEPEESIYYKRHIAVGIASMYGEYREKKFDAVGAIFRVEKGVSHLLSSMTEAINLDYISASTMRKVLKILDLYSEGLAIDGIENRGLESNINMLRYSLKSRSFSLEQYLNIFSFIHSNIKEIINEYFYRTFDKSLKMILPQLTDISDQPATLKRTEKFYREILSSAFLLQDFDVFVTKVISSMQGMMTRFTPEFNMKVLSYDPDMVVSSLHSGYKEFDNRVFIGAKAYFLKQLVNYGIKVPPGFILTTELFRNRQTVTSYGPMYAEVEKKIMAKIREIERTQNSRFGDVNAPLLFSVRSGTAISLPGAMSTFLNVGLNREIAEALSHDEGRGWMAWDSYRRLLQSWGMAEGLERDEFDRIIADYKKSRSVEHKTDLAQNHMKELALLYESYLKEKSIHFPSEPFEQLMGAIRHVMNSWDSRRAKVFRENLSIAREWGTAVLVQKMVFGNKNQDSGTGVVLTHEPHSMKAGVKLYGEFTLCNQGEDVVSGLVNTLPITEKQRRDMPDASVSLEKDFPDLYNKLFSLAQELIHRRGFSHQEIEFTFESSDAIDLNILQIRPQIFVKKAEYQSFDTSPEEMKILGRGIGIGEGVLNGYAVFDREDILKVRNKIKEPQLILLRPDTVPDDIDLILECEGLWTSRGGACSHAAITASELGKYGVVGCRELHVHDEKKYAQIGEEVLRSGDKISVDTGKGFVFAGHYPIKKEMM